MRNALFSSCVVVFDFFFFKALQLLSCPHTTGYCSYINPPQKQFSWATIGRHHLGFLFLPLWRPGLCHVTQVSNPLESTMTWDVAQITVSLRSKAHPRKGKLPRPDNGNTGIWTCLGHPPLSSSCLNRVLDQVVSRGSFQLQSLCIYILWKHPYNFNKLACCCMVRNYLILYVVSAFIMSLLSVPHTFDTFKGNLSVKRQISIFYRGVIGYSENTKFQILKSVQL